MGVFKVSKELVLRLLRLIDGDKGLEQGAAGEGQPTFCVQQAVSLATGHPDRDDSPTHCVMPWLIALGVAMNDAGEWSSDEARAAGLREFAIAELGSVNLREGSLRRELAKKANAKWRADVEHEDEKFDAGSNTSEYVDTAEDDGEAGLIALAKMVVETLQEMKCPGTEYLCMANKKEYEKPEGFGRIPPIKPYSSEQRAKAWVSDTAPWGPLG